MSKSLIKILPISYLFLICLNINGNIMLNENDKLANSLPLPYDGKVYNVNDLNKFIDNSIDSSKQPIIIFGANWCPDCRIFSGTMDIPKIHSYINKHFEILYIDVKRYEINSFSDTELGVVKAFCKVS